MGRTWCGIIANYEDPGLSFTLGYLERCRMTREFMQKLLDSGEGFKIEYKKKENKLSSVLSVTVTVVMFYWE